MEALRHISIETIIEDGLPGELAVELGKTPLAGVPELLFGLTRAVKQAASGSRVALCSIVNAKSGRCPEDCRFCAQSAHYRTEAPVHPLMPADEIARVAAGAKRNRAARFSIVTSGKGVTEPEEISSIAEAIAEIRALGIRTCASPGIVGEDTLRAWMDAGLARYHHNLETAPSFFKNVCATHDIEEDIEAVRTAKNQGLEVCAGGIFGMGESWEQRVELALLLRELEVDSVPVNFFTPIEGTPLAESAPGVTPLEALLTIAMLRLVLPGAGIILCGGRPTGLGELQPLALLAGADGLMIGNYLTTIGRPPERDLAMIEQLGMEPEP